MQKNQNGLCLMANSFNREDLARYYDDVEACLYCNKYRADCFHHCISRSRKYTNSILNASPLCNHSCHLPNHGDHMKRENQVKFIKQNAERLNREGYKLTELDMNFLVEHELLELIKKIL